MYRLVRYSIVPLFLLLVACQEEQVASDDVVAAVDSLEVKLDWLEYRLAAERWDRASSGQADSLDFYTDLYRHTFADDSILQVLLRGRGAVSEDVDRRRYHLVQQLLLGERVENAPDVRRLKDSLTGPHLLSGRRPRGWLRASYLLDGAWSDNASQTLREQSFVAHFSELDNLRSAVSRLIRMRNQVAKRLGYSSYASLVLGTGSLGLDDLLRLIGEIESATDAAYTSLLDDLARTEAVGRLEIWDLAVPYARGVAQLDSRLSPEQVVEVINSSLTRVDYRLDTLPLYFDLQPGATSTGSISVSEILPGHEARILVETSGGYSALRQALAATGEALAFLGRDRSASALFSRLCDRSWDEGMAAIFASLSTDSSWLAAQVGLAPDQAAEWHRLMAAQSLINLRLALTDFMFEFEAYKNPQRDLDRLYWDLFERYVKLSRHDGLFVWARRPELVSQPFDVRDAILGQLVAAQTKAYFVDRYGSFAGNPELRSFLGQSYFRYGSRYPWPQLLERGTGQPPKSDFLTSQLAAARELR